MDEFLHGLGILLVASLATLAALQSLGGVHFMRALWRGSLPPPANPHTPRVTVVLCLRGGDPFLHDCIRGVLEQDYPDFELLVVVDHLQDPAADVLRQTLATLPEDLTRRARVVYRDEDESRCSLKCSSLVQAVHALSEDVELFVQLDADTIPHRSWLQDLAEPFRDPRVGAATGNRWYAPKQFSVAAVMRRVWNMGAIVTMFLARIPWGGTLAVRMSLLRDSELTDRWERSFCEDTLLYAYLKSKQLQVAFVPSLMMTNREDCRFCDFFPWLRRQLLTVRLYHPSWRMLLLHGVGSAGLWLATFALAIWGWLAQDGALAQLALIAVALYTVVLIIGQSMLQYFINRIARRQQQSCPTISWTNSALVPLLTVVTPLAYAFALVGACLLKKTTWRGIDYHIHGPWDISRGAYRPYAQTPAAEQPHSL